jgi:hypothetical protein
MFVVVMCTKYNCADHFQISEALSNFERPSDRLVTVAHFIMHVFSNQVCTLTFIMYV